MKLAHAADYGLAGLFVGLYAEGGVFFSKFLQTHAQFVKVFLRFGFHGDADNGIGEFHGFEHYGMVLVAEGVAGADILEAYACADVAAADDLFGVLLVGVHLEQTAYALFLA